MSRKIILVFIVLLFALSYAWSRIKVVELGYEVSKLQSQVSEMARDNSLLRSKVAAGGSTSRLADWARRFGMTPPDAAHVLFLEKRGE